MKYPASISAEAWLARRGEFSAVLDARSPAEFALDKLPAALNTPVLSNEQRELIGTVNAQQSPFEAKRQGAALVAENIGALLKTEIFAQDKSWQPMVYCWRGGNRSGSLAHILAKIGWPAYQLEGGYKAFRNVVRAQLDALPPSFKFIVLAGPTGSAKSRLLEALALQGAQVLDLELLANHRGSVLGSLGAQPSQKHFETLIWEKLSKFNTHQVIFVESESAKIGLLRVPEILLQTMRGSDCVRVELPFQARLDFLLSEYQYFFGQSNLLIEKISHLSELHSKAQLAQWREMIETQDWQGFVSSILKEHYDPAYFKSMGRNYTKTLGTLELNTTKNLTLSAAQLIEQTQ